jgi:serine/threonine protein kinase
MIDKIMRCDYSFRSPVWKMISDDAKAFVSSLIVMDPKKRLDAKQALGHQWFSHEETLSADEPPEELLRGIEAGLLKYANTSELKKIALNVSVRCQLSDLLVIDSFVSLKLNPPRLSAGDCLQINWG